MSVHITTDQLIRIMPASSHVAGRYVDALNEAFDNFEINTPLRVAAFIAQTGHESTRFTKVEENLNYSPNGLLRTFQDYFSPEQAKEYAYKPERIANRVYANKGDNGDEASGDGWKFRGRGLMQITLKRNYFLAGKRLTGNSDTFIRDPNLLLLPEWSVRAACDYWDHNNLNELADRGTQDEFRNLTRKINRGLRGLDDRIFLWNEAKKALGISGSDN